MFAFSPSSSSFGGGSKKTSNALVPLAITFGDEDYARDPVIQCNGAAPSTFTTMGIPHGGANQTRFAVLPQLSLPASAISAKPRRSTATAAPPPIPNRTYKPKVHCTPIPRMGEEKQCAALPPGPIINKESSSSNLAALFAKKAEEMKPAPATTAASAPVILGVLNASSSSAEYRVIADPAAPELEKYFKMRKMGIPQGAIENAMLKDMVHPKSVFGAEAINADPKPPKIVITAAAAPAADAAGGGDRKKSLLEELARKQQERLLGGGPQLSVEEQVQRNKVNRIKGSTPINLISRLRPTAAARTDAASGANAAPLVLKPVTRNGTRPKPNLQQRGGVGGGSKNKRKGKPFDILIDLLITLKLEEDVVEVQKRFASEGFDTPDRLVLFLLDDARAETLLPFVNGNGRDVDKICAVLPKLEEMMLCKEALDNLNQDPECIAAALLDYERIVASL